MASILLTDDNPAVAFALLKGLVRAGHRVTLAPTVDEAVAELSAATAHGEPFDAIVLDFWLSGESSFAIIGWMDDNAPSLVDRTYFMTGDVFSDIGAARRAVAALGRPILFKPFTTAELEALVTSGR